MTFSPSSSPCSLLLLYDNVQVFRLLWSKNILKMSLLSTLKSVVQKCKCFLDAILNIPLLWQNIKSLKVRLCFSGFDAIMSLDVLVVSLLFGESASV